METPEKSGVFPYPGSGVVHFWCIFRRPNAAVLASDVDAGTAYFFTPWSVARVEG
ncbi:hypothetical protein [Microbacterium sp. CGR1]|uniref:hypothetical protein n=1 Tax=Microbacterium sp. CGR1 TaxID=1696072 RepID=UPI0014947894|nr:hypothetical protein [Microbacterium sp. CGR1]